MLFFIFYDAVHVHHHKYDDVQHIAQFGRASDF